MRPLLLIFFAGLLLSPVFAQDLYTFQQAYPLGITTTFSAAVPAPEGGFYLAARGINDIFLFRTDTTGQIEWLRQYDLGNDEAVYGLQTFEGGCLIVGGIIGQTTSSRDGFFLKVDLDGNVLELAQLDQGNSSNAFHSIRPTPDGNYIVAGRSLVGPGGSYLMLLAKVDPQGNILWSNSFGAGGWEWGFWAEPASDGGYILVGEADGFGEGFGDVYLVKTDALGQKEWSWAYGSSTAEQPFCVKATADGGFLVGGRTLGFDPNDFTPKGFLLKVEADGTLSWMKAYRGIYEITQFSLLDDGGIVGIGFSQQAGGFGGNELTALRTDAEGNVLWARIYGSEGGEGSGYAFPLPDGGFLLSGSTNGFDTGNLSPYLLKTDAEGRTGCQEIDIELEVVIAEPVVSLPPDQAAPGFSLLGVEASDQLLEIQPQLICCSDLPVLSFSWTIDTASLLVSFENNSTNGNGYEWDFGDGVGSSAFDPNHQYVLPGSYEVCLTAGNACGTATFCDTLDLVLISTTEPDEQGFALSYSAAGHQLRYEHLEAPEGELFLYGLSGQLLGNWALTGPAGQISLPELPAGMYVYWLWSGEEGHSGKVFIF